MTATTEATKRESEETMGTVTTTENGSSNNCVVQEPIVENPRKSLKLKKMSNGQLEKRVYKIVLTGGK